MKYVSEYVKYMYAKYMHIEHAKTYDNNKYKFIQIALKIRYLLKRETFSMRT